MCSCRTEHYVHAKGLTGVWGTWKMALGIMLPWRRTFASYSSTKRRQESGQSRRRPSNTIALCLTWRPIREHKGLVSRMRG